MQGEQNLLAQMASAQRCLTAPLRSAVSAWACDDPNFRAKHTWRPWLGAARILVKPSRTNTMHVYGKDYWFKAGAGPPPMTAQQSLLEFNPQPEATPVQLRPNQRVGRALGRGSSNARRVPERCVPTVQAPAEGSSPSGSGLHPAVSSILSSNGPSRSKSRNKFTQAVDSVQAEQEETRRNSFHKEEAPTSRGTRDALRLEEPQPTALRPSMPVPESVIKGFLGLGEFVGGMFGGRLSGGHLLGGSCLAGKQETDLVEIKGTIMLPKKNILDFVNPSAMTDNVLDSLGWKVELRLVSLDLHPETNDARVSTASTIDDWASSDELLITGEDDAYPVTFRVPADFGEPGAVLVRNDHSGKFRLTSISLKLPDSSTVEFPCNSWVYPTSYNGGDRVFFSNKQYLPSNTPPSLTALRERDLAEKRGDGTGERKPCERIYDYDVYNDLSNPDASPPINRHVLGGSKEFRYPRRLRTGRRRCRNDPNAEVPVFMLDLEATYKPRDEVMSRKNYCSFLSSGLMAAVHALLPVIFCHFHRTPNEFDALSEITDLYGEGLDLEESLVQAVDSETLGSGLQDDALLLIQQLSTSSSGGSDLKFPKPQVIAADKHAWTKDDEFGRQFLAGMNPCNIELLKEFPPKSSLDTEVYGPASALTRAHIEPHLNGLTVEQLFIVDYDILKTYVNRINALGEGKTYASHTILLLTEEGRLKPIAIELALPPCPENGTQGSIRVLTAPPESATETTDYLCLLAKIHVGSVDLGFHELFAHWLSTHAVLEPFIISLHRNLSVVHPIFTLLLPHAKNNIYMNSIGRQSLIRAGGIIERATTPGKYAMEMSAKLYDALWQFDKGNLPKDLVARGMAEETDDPRYPGGVRLVIEDYPYAKDGLEIWDAIAKWVRSYVQIIYNGSDDAVQGDAELQAFWSEAVSVGHADLADQAWWPMLDSVSSLESVLTTLIWTAGPMHAAVNFGQYAYAGYMPNRCSVVRRLVPEEGSPEHQELMADPERFLLSAFATETVTALALLTTEVLSTHSVDEEYLGQRSDTNWTSDPALQAAFATFGEEIQAVGKRIEQRNADSTLFHRRGPANVPYTLLYPTSPPGVTARGVPNSTSL